MPRPARASFPEDFTSVRQQFDAWRASDVRPRRLPDHLWQQAVLLARKYGLNLTKMALGLDYYSLKRRVDGWHREMSPRRKHAGKANASSRPDSARTHRATDLGHNGFLELPVHSLSSGPEYVIEFTRVSGASLRVQWKGNQPPDLMALGEQFWSGR